MGENIVYLHAADGAPNAVQTFVKDEDRKRLTPTAVEALTRIADAWKLTGSEAAPLLGLSETTWDRVKAGHWKQSFSQDQLMRASAIIGIWKGLHLLFIGDLADRWPKLANRGPLFENRAPVTAMIEGGIPFMLEVRRHVDALRGGL
ncbi:antitoxin Xre-like helix-turn-helix domain-containing protein [Dongia sp.]|uniref:antitoxin Xre-like helix-turn-helix domain-containing protein n=1 Tax=Dongia sp. TaxID=1977262 RepID=UPI0035AEEAF6